MIRGTGISNILEYCHKVGSGTTINTNTTTTLTSDLYTDFIALSNGGSINTNGYRIFCRGDLTGANGGAIFNRGLQGQDGATPSVGGQKGIGAPGNTLSPGYDGGDGANCLPAGNLPGQNGNGDGSTSAAIGTGSGAAAGDGGTGATRASGIGAVAEFAGNIHGSIRNHLFATTAYMLSRNAGSPSVVCPSGGAGGGGGGGNHASNRAGGGGGGGGGIYISCGGKITLSDSFQIDASGGRGGIGTTDMSGGGGGTGGFINIHAVDVQLNGTSKLNVDGGVAGAGNGTGASGAAGSPGSIYIFSEKGTQVFGASVSGVRTLPDSV